MRPKRPERPEPHGKSAGDPGSNPDTVLNSISVEHKLIAGFDRGGSTWILDVRPDAYEEHHPMSNILDEIANGAERAAQVDAATKVGRVLIEINGSKIEVAASATFHDVLTQAKGARVIEGSVNEYMIERFEEEGEIGHGKTIAEIEGRRFIAVPAGRTQVA